MALVVVPAAAQLAVRFAGERTPVAGPSVASDADRDGDGVSGASDRCPLRAGLPADGCPPRDRDGDGVIDRADECDTQAGPHGNRGCPDKDADRDGVVDRRDDCATLPGLADRAGCRAPDGDGDGVADDVDACVDRAEVWNGRRDGDGCPDRGRALFSLAGSGTAVVSGRLFRSSGAVRGRGRAALSALSAYVGAFAAHRAWVVVEHEGEVPTGESAARRVAAIRDRLRGDRPRLAVVVEERAGEEYRLTVRLE